ncbi:MAG: helix-turn-helix domain-containing protein [Candidatus Omnitrophica bacterium]|nr:helix-turn-helix domain-containing protein [Candidatus Omnitrophota bacterium]
MKSNPQLIHREGVQRVRRNRWEPCDAVTAAQIKLIRKRLKVSQSQFAFLIGVKVATLQNWEQGRTKPEGPAQTLLRVIAHDPNIVMEALYPRA